MKASVRGTLLMYAVLALLFLAQPPFDGARLMMLLIYAALFFGAYRFNLARAHQDGEEKPLSGSAGIAAAICLLGLLLNLFPDREGAGGMVRDNLAVVCFLLGFFATQPLLREYGSVAAWLLFNLWLFLLPGISMLLAPLFIAAFVIHRFAVTAHTLGDEYGVPEHGATPQAQRTLLAWLCLAVLLFVPLQGWGWWEDRQLQQQMQAVSERDVPPPAGAGMGLAGRSGLIGFGIILFAYVAWRQLQKREKRGDGKKELQALLSAQGYTRDLDDACPVRYSFPGGRRGQMLKLYDKVLAAAEKRLKQPLRSITPSLRIPYLKRLDPARDWETLTVIFNRARYGHEDLAPDDLAAAKRIAGR